MNGDYSVIFQTLDTVADYILAGNSLSEEDLDSICMTIANMNMQLLECDRLNVQKIDELNTDEDWLIFGNELKAIHEAWTEVESHSDGIDIDVSFWKNYCRFKYADRDSLVQVTIDKFESLEAEIKDYFLDLRSKFPFLSTSLNYKTKDYSIIEQHTDMMLNNYENYRWLYERLSDYRSKASLNGIIEFWFDFDLVKMQNHREHLYKDYYDVDIMRYDKDAVMVDFGAFTGDSVKDYIDTFGAYKKIYAFEMTPGTFGHMETELEAYPDIVCINKAVGKEKGYLDIYDGMDTSGNSIFVKGNTRVEMTTLDEEIKEPVSIIKMDIEGAEKDAIIGAKQHIIDDKPQLLISAYHFPEDIFDIPMLINDIRDDYRLYLRFNGRALWPCDYVLFAI